MVFHHQTELCIPIMSLYADPAQVQLERLDKNKLNKSNFKKFVKNLKKFVKNLKKFVKNFKKVCKKFLMGC